MSSQALLDPIHPGEILLEDFMKPLGISINQLARDLDVPPNRVSMIVNGGPFDHGGYGASTGNLLWGFTGNLAGATGGIRHSADAAAGRGRDCTAGAGAASGVTAVLAAACIRNAECEG